MRTKSILKIAVVATAALAAYAFNGNSSSQNSLYIHKDGLCRNIEEVCDFNGNYSCKIITLGGTPYQVWSDLMCNIEAEHSISTPIPYDPKL